MAAHIRQQVRLAIIELLTGATEAGANVFPDPPAARAIDARLMPAICVYTGQDVRGQASAGMSTIDIRVEIVFLGVGAGVSDIMDGIQLAVEKLLAVDPTLGGLSYDSAPEQTTLAVDKGAEPVGNQQLTYLFRCAVSRTDPSIVA